ncbi:DNA gyrase subunit A [Membranihabitans maritimus]|uniref:DNA gyrase subunit A n=1 Tax=Membranihabitans maritimus TaxID=2904244 RepID=UPI001F00B9F3|nr:DNA gyrase subunit A [Membranihabitans maritimus]
MADLQRIIPINIEDEMKSAYIDYSMSVIVSRALPDVRDGLKPVHRRILYAMQDLGLYYNKSHRKSARVVGEVLGKYHPHGDSSVYEAMVRMAQDWSLRYPMVDGQGNFGHIDGDGPAAMRYTEARLARIADEMLSDIKKDTVDFELNFDDSIKEPTVLPARIPNLLVNGASGIAVGMATNMLPHNLREIIDGTIATIKDPQIDTDGLMEYIKAPDFPTGGIIYGVEGVKEAFETGRGRVVVRGKAEIIADAKGRETIIVTEIPYQVSKAGLVIKMSELRRDEKVPGISEIRDESDREGIRIVIEVKRDAMAQVVLSKLYKYSQLQTSYGVNNVALVKGRPQTLSLKSLIEEFIEFRIEVIVRRTQFELKKAEERAHIVEGLIIAVDNIDEVIKIIRGSGTVDEARNSLMDRFDLSEIQAKAILELRLQKLTGLEIEKLREEYNELMEKIKRFKEILASVEIQKDIVVEELMEIRERYGDERRTEVTFADGEISIEDMIPNEEMMVSISHLGYIKRTKSDQYKVQGRGGKGSKGSRTRDKDFVEHIFVANAHNYLLLFTEMGRCYWLRIYEIPEGSRNGSGRVMQNILQIPKEDKVKTYIVVKDLTDQEFLQNNFVMFCTKNGLIKKTTLEAYSRPRVNGINAITINEGDYLIDARLTDGNKEVILANRNGRAIRFNESKVRSMGRNAAGVKGITLDDSEDQVVGMVCVDPDDPAVTILVISEKGNGKRTDVDEYRITNRGGKGVKTMNISEKTGKLIAIKAVVDDDHIVITNRSGLMIRMALSEIRVMGRATQGVRVISLNKGDAIADITVIKPEEEEDIKDLDNTEYEEEE